MKPRPAEREKRRPVALAPRARLLLLVLALLVPTLAPGIAEASVPRASSAGDASLTNQLTPAALAPLENGSVFTLFAGDEIAQAQLEAEVHAGRVLAAHVRELRLDLDEQLELLLVEPLRGPPASDPETRIGARGVFLGTRIGAEEKLSLGLHWVCGNLGCEIAEDQRKDPLGLSWTTFSYGVAEGAINMALGLGQMVMRATAPALVSNQQVSVNLTRAGQPMVNVSQPTLKDELKNASVVIPVGETLGRFTGNAYMAGRGSVEGAPQEYLDDLHADLGRDTPAVAMIVAPVPKMVRAARVAKAQQSLIQTVAAEAKVRRALPKSVRGDSAVTGRMLDTKTLRVTGEKLNAYELPPDLDPLLMERVEHVRSLEKAPHYSAPGTHVEVLAADELLKARRAAGEVVSSATLRDFVSYQEWLRGSPGAAPMCGNCATILPEVKSIPGKR